MESTKDDISRRTANYHPMDGAQWRWHTGHEAADVPVQVAVQVDAADAAAALVLALKKLVTVQVFAPALTWALVQCRYFLSFQEQLLAHRGVVVESVIQESGSRKTECMSFRSGWWSRIGTARWQNSRGVIDIRWWMRILWMDMVSGYHQLWINSNAFV